MINLPEQYEYLLLGKLTGTLSAEEEKELENIYRKDTSLQKAYEELINNLPADQVAQSFDYLNHQGYWKDIASELGENKNSADRKTAVRPLYKWIAAAAIIAVVTTGGWLFYKQQENSSESIKAVSKKQPAIELKLTDGSVINLSNEKGELAAGNARLDNTDNALSYTVTGKEGTGMNSVTVPVGMNYRINLNDGSVVWLNSATKLGFPFSFSGKTREITIQGEAYLQVAADKQKPFIVHLPGSSVQVLGTEFNVNTYDSESVRVALVEGAVNMRSAAGELKLYPGKEGIYRKDRDIMQKSFDPKHVLSWRKGLFYFDEATLEEISKVIPRWFGIQVIIDNPNINNKKFVGVLDRNQPIHVFQNDLKEIAGIDSYIDKENVLHFKL